MDLLVLRRRPLRGLAAGCARGEPEDCGSRGLHCQCCGVCVLRLARTPGCAASSGRMQRPWLWLLEKVNVLQP